MGQAPRQAGGGGGGELNRDLGSGIWKVNPTATGKSDEKRLRQED